MSNAREKLLTRILDTITTSRIESLGRHQQSHVEQLREVLAQPNVVGVGISDKISKGKKLGKLSITFYVEKKLPLKKLSGHHVIPPAVPESLSGSSSVPTDVIELRKLQLQDTPPFIRKEPIQPGNSVGHFRSTAGTLGAIVMRGKTRMILSNSHVLALSGKAKPGDAILYPGKADKGKSPSDVIARLLKSVKFVQGGEFVNEVDCAVAEIHPPNVRPIIAAMRACKGPNGVATPKRGMRIQISGRTSGVSSGEITDINLRSTIDYPGVGSVGFKNVVLCTPYSQPGDSGALVIERRSRRAVGLHFAGNVGKNGGSVFCPIDKVLKMLGVKLEVASGRTPKASAQR